MHAIIHYNGISCASGDEGHDDLNIRGSEARRVGFANEIEGGHLEGNGPLGDAGSIAEQVSVGMIRRAVAEHEERVPPCTRVLLDGESTLHKARRVWNEPLATRQAEDHRDCGERVLADERVRVLEIGDDGGHNRLEQLRLAEPAEEPQRDAANVFVGVLEVVAEVVGDEDHLRDDLAGGLVPLVHDLG